MKKIRVGIVGFGNLGKEVEKIVASDERFRLVAIFSRRQIDSPFGSLCEKFENIEKFAKKIDVMFLCGGSKSDIEKQAFVVAKHFHTIDCFDNHARISTYRQKLNEQNKKNKKCSIISCGWDPGLFSMMRALFECIDNSHETFWGKGVSQGHSQALREIEGVVDAIQFTIPSRRAMKLVERGENVPEKSKHTRLCFVHAQRGANKRLLRLAIRNMPDYFEGYMTKIKFCSQKKIDKLKAHMSHKGYVTSLGGAMRFELNLKSNPHFTARVLVAFSVALYHLAQNKEYGAKTILEVPISSLFCDEEFMSLI